MWMRELSGERINDVRIRELIEDKPKTITTACPYCLVMFEDAASSLGIEEVRCMDIIEVIRDSI